MDNGIPNQWQAPKYIFLALLICSCISGCSRSDKPAYTIDVVRYGFSGSLGFTAGGNSLYKLHSDDRSATLKINQSAYDADSLAVTTHPAEQICTATSPGLDEESGTIEVSFWCQRYQYGPGNVTDFAVSYRSICAVVGNRIQCWGDAASSSIDFEREYQNPRLLAFGSQETLCFVDDAGLNCSAGAEWDTEQINANAENIRELEISAGRLCYIDDNGLSCLPQDSLLGSHSTDLTAPEQLSIASFRGCVLDNGRPYCWPNQDIRIGELLTPVQIIKASEYNICYSGSDRVGCESGRQGLYDMGLVVDLVVTQFVSCAITIDGPMCWDNSFPDSTLVLENLFNVPEKVEYVPMSTNEGCGLEDGQLLCFGGYDTLIDLN